jgi:hypothetical protein
VEQAALGGQLCSFAVSHTDHVKVNSITGQMRASRVSPNFPIPLWIAITACYDNIVPDLLTEQFELPPKLLITNCPATPVDFQSKRIGEHHGIIAYVGVEINVAAKEADRVLTNEPLEVGVVVARPTVTPAASLAGESTADPAASPR